MGTQEDRSRHYQRVQSSMMTSVRYDRDARKPQITFTGGKTYRYLNVLPELYADLLNAESKGEFFNGNIRDAVAFAEVRSRGKGNPNSDLDRVTFVAGAKAPSDSPPRQFAKQPDVPVSVRQNKNGRFLFAPTPGRSPEAARAIRLGRSTSPCWR
jgi:hypothetical protein